MPRTARLTMLLATLALAGCSARPPLLNPDQPIVAEPRPGGPHLAEVRRLAPENGLVDPFPTAVQRFLIGPDGRTVVVEFVGGQEECYGVADVTVQPGEPPAISVIGGRRQLLAGQGCDDIGIASSVVVTLDDPILVDLANPEPALGEPIVALEATQVQSAAGIVDARPSTVWGYALTPDGRQLSIYYGGGTEECYGLASVDVTAEEGEPVSVLVKEGRRPDAPVACPDIGVSKVVVVDLDAPILVDGSTR